MAENQPPKLTVRVRCPSPAPVAKAQAARDFSLAGRCSIGGPSRAAGPLAGHYSGCLRGGLLTVTGMDIDGFWIFLERSARETTSPHQRIQWLEHPISPASRTHVEDFQAHLSPVLRQIDTHALWG